MINKEDIHMEQYALNPIIRPTFGNPVIADPTFLPPDQTPDGKWHLFSHSLFGVHHYVSDNGIHWNMLSGLVSKLSVRPYIYKENDIYYLFYEKVDSIRRFPFYDSHMELMRSSDLIHWEKPIPVILPSLSWHKTRNKVGNIGNPFLVKLDNGYKIYYSAGLYFMRDCKFCEPRYFGCAYSEKIEGPYTLASDPIYEVEGKNFIIAHKSVKYLDVYIGMQTRFYFTGILSHCYIGIVFSRDGMIWENVEELGIWPEKGWRSSHVYAGDLKLYEDKIYFYYNARNGRMPWSKEHVGLAIITISPKNSVTSVL